MKDVAKAFQIIREKQACFVSRGDHSGTHIAEINLWKVYGPHGKSISNQADRHRTDAPMPFLLPTSGISAPPAAPVELKTTIVSDAPKRVRNVRFWHKATKTQFRCPLLGVKRTSG